MEFFYLLIHNTITMWYNINMKRAIAQTMTLQQTRLDGG